MLWHDELRAKRAAFRFLRHCRPTPESPLQFACPSYESTIRDPQESATKNLGFIYDWQLHSMCGRIGAAVGRSPVPIGEKNAGLIEGQLVKHGLHFIKAALRINHRRVALRH